MALGALFVLFIILTTVSILSITLLYTLKNEKLKNMFFYFLCGWSIIITSLNITALPSNYLVSRLIASIFGLLAVISIIIKIKKPHKKSLSYLLASASALLGLVDLFFF